MNTSQANKPVTLPESYVPAIPLITIFCQHLLKIGVHHRTDEDNWWLYLTQYYTHTHNNTHTHHTNTIPCAALLTVSLQTDLYAKVQDLLPPPHLSWHKGMQSLPDSRPHPLDLHSKLYTSPPAHIHTYTHLLSQCLSATTFQRVGIIYWCCNDFQLAV